MQSYCGCCRCILHSFIKSGFPDFHSSCGFADGKAVVEGHARGAVRTPGQSWRGAMVEKFYLLPSARAGAGACVLRRRRAVRGQGPPKCMTVTCRDSYRSPTSKHAGHLPPNMRRTCDGPASFLGPNLGSGDQWGSIRTRKPALRGRTGGADGCGASRGQLGHRRQSTARQIPAQTAARHHINHVLFDVHGMNAETVGIASHDLFRDLPRNTKSAETDSGNP